MSDSVLTATGSAVRYYAGFALTVIGFVLALPGLLLALPGRKLAFLGDRICAAVEADEETYPE